MPRVFRNLIATTCLLLSPAAATAQTGAEATGPASGSEPARYQVRPATSAIVIDGRLDEPAWKDATSIPLEYEWFPGDNTPAPVETEALLNRALERLCANKTVLLIAHRLSTIEQADRIIVMDHGELAESGTKAELIVKGGIYASMLQTKHDIEDAGMLPAAAS